MNERLARRRQELSSDDLLKRTPLLTVRTGARMPVRHARGNKEKRVDTHQSQL